MKKFTLSLKKRVFISSVIAFCIFSGFSDRDEQTLFIQNLLIKYYDSDVNRKDIKRFEINVTNNGFCRYRKIYNNGKQELFAFNLSSFKTMDSVSYTHLDVYKRQLLCLQHLINHVYVGSINYL